jgi:hypothetical protein
MQLPSLTCAMAATLQYNMHHFVAVMAYPQ